MAKVDEEDVENLGYRFSRLTVLEGYQMHDPYVVPNDEFRMLLTFLRKEKKNLTSYRTKGKACALTEVKLKEKKIGDSSSEEEEVELVRDVKKKKVNRLQGKSSAEESQSERDSDDLEDSSSANMKNSVVTKSLKASGNLKLTAEENLSERDSDELQDNRPAIKKHSVVTRITKAIASSNLRQTIVRVNGTQKTPQTNV